MMNKEFLFNDVGHGYVYIYSIMLDVSRASLV